MATRPRASFDVRGMSRLSVRTTTSVPMLASAAQPAVRAPSVPRPRQSPANDADVAISDAEQEQHHVAQHPLDARHQQPGEVAERLVLMGKRGDGHRVERVLRAVPDPGVAVGHRVRVGGVHVGAAAAADDVVAGRGRSGRRVAAELDPAVVVLEVVHVAADRGDVAVVGVVDEIPDRLARPVALPLPDPAGMHRGVDQQRLAGDQDLGLAIGRDPLQPLTLLGVEVAVDAGVDRHDPQVVGVDRVVRAGLADRPGQGVAGDDRMIMAVPGLRRRIGRAAATGCGTAGPAATWLSSSAGCTRPAAAGPDRRSGT